MPSAVPPPDSPTNAISAGWRRVKAMIRPARFEGRITYGAEPSPPVVERLVLGVIDDPDQSMRLLSVRGSLSAFSITALAEALGEIPGHAKLHLDLNDVEFANAAVIARLGAMLDVLEERGVRIRIVGLGHLASVRLD